MSFWKKRNRHRTSRAARQREEDETRNRSSLLDLLSNRQDELSNVDRVARQQVGLSADFAPPSSVYNPVEAEARARARGLKAVTLARINELKKQLGEEPLTA